mgnify:CR=1 FL=1
MKMRILWIAAAALLATTSCSEGEPKTFTGFITDATMNTVTVQDLTAESTYTFSTEEADRSEAYGLLVGAPVVVEYRGKLEDGIEAVKVSTNPTYAEAVGRWMLVHSEEAENPEVAMGIDIRIEGEAVSINSSTLLYTGWELLDEADQILLRGRSVGNGESFDFSQTGLISKDSAGNYTLTIEGTKVVFTKVADDEAQASDSTPEAVSETAPTDPVESTAPEAATAASETATSDTAAADKR